MSDASLQPRLALGGERPEEGDGSAMAIPLDAQRSEPLAQTPPPAAVENPAR